MPFSPARSGHGTAGVALRSANSSHLDTTGYQFRAVTRERRASSLGLQAAGATQPPRVQRRNVGRLS